MVVHWIDDPNRAFVPNGHRLPIAEKGENDIVLICIRCWNSDGKFIDCVHDQRSV